MADPLPAAPRRRLEPVQVLRAVAALAVVTVHLPLPDCSSWGVDIFFVISGFIICYVTSASSRNFIAKRLIRIVPLYWAATLGVFAVALVAPGLLHDTTASPTALLKSLAFVPFQKGREITPVLFLGWTLNAEVYFYALFAVAMKLSHRYRAPLCAIFLGAVVAYARAVTPRSVLLHFYGRPIMLEIVLGMLCYALYTWMGGRPLREHRPGARFLWAAAAALCLLSVPVTFLLTPHVSPLLRAGLPAALALFSALHGLPDARWPRALVLLGDASYPLYLFHTFVLQVFRLAGAFSVPGASVVVMSLVAMAACCWMAVLVHRRVEIPIAEYLRKRLVRV